MLRRFALAQRALLVSQRRSQSSLRAAPAANLSESDKYRPGDMVSGFTVEEVTRIEEMHLEAIRLTHASTGARYLHLCRDDSNNVFSINFRTIPKDSTGLPHVLEHTVLCGSERYPCRDPFFKMLRRSLATFLNAMTGPDYTLYPLSTQNPKDFRNLQSVYLDVVFRPSLRELDFRQEGWRLEHADVNDVNSPIKIKGVVYNEMKGVFNENQAIFAERFMNSLLPSHTYAYCSGGDPLVIPEMTHEALVNFHAKHYHPSNARFFSYGNFPLEDHLKLVNEKYLSRYQKIDTSATVVPSEKRWEHPRREHVDCKPDPLAADPDKQSSIAIGQLCNDIKDVRRSFEFYVLFQLLLKGPNSAFYKSLVESNLGTGFGPLTGFEPQTRDTIFVVSLQGVCAKDFEKIERVYDETLRRVVDEGFAKDHVEAVLHGIELQTKHQTSNFGLNLLFSLTPLWNHDGDIITSMRINEAIKTLTERLAEDPKYLNKLAETHLLKNTHRLVLTMSPDEKHEARRSEAEEKLLKAKVEALSAEDKRKTFEDGLALLADQKKEEPEVLPTLKIEDLKPDVERYETRDVLVSGVPVQLSVQPTNGIAYFRAVLSTRDLEDDLKGLLPLFNDTVARMGTGSHDYRSFDRLCQLRTGGLIFGSHVAESKSNTSRYEEGVILTSYCLDKNADAMWQLWEELFNEVTLEDAKRFENLAKESAGELVNGIADSGHIYAMSTAKSLVSASARLRESLSGLEFVARMKRIARSKNFEEILDKVRKIGEHVLRKERLRSAVNLSPENQRQVVAGMEQFYGKIRGESGETLLITNGKVTSENDENAVHHVMPYSVNYCSKAIHTVPYTNPEYATLRVLAKLVTHFYLFPELREKGGAYGAGANLSAEGIFGFYSYRDPNSTKTLDVFDGTYDFLMKYEFPQRDIDEAKLGVFQQVDAPVPPGNRGMARFTHGLTDDDIQEQRERLKTVTKEQILRVAEKYLKPGASGRKIGRALLGPKNEEIKERKSQGWTVIEQEDEGQAGTC